MKEWSKKEIGDLGEQKAVNYLRLRGYTVKERNWFAGKHEIDIIAASLRDIVFVEVKTRTYDLKTWQTAPPPGLAVHTNKQSFTRHAAGEYLYLHPTKKQPRMDVIEVWLSKPENGRKPKLLKINHIKAAY